MALGTGEADAMHLPAQGDEGAVSEGDGFWKAFELSFQPIHMTGKERAGIFDASPIGKRQDRGTLGVADFKGKPFRAWRASQFHGAPGIGDTQNGSLLKRNNRCC
ncbi:hypothetical protein [Rhodomicrobium lacus]|uniref:hypothetical protein n=1 Tax=Rhodomicrobium lacus TaxID=2498452 RepID=UPI00349FA67C